VLRFSVRMTMMLAFAMSCFGLLVVSYASKTLAKTPYQYCIFQSVYLALGLVAVAVLWRVPYRIFRNPALLWPLLATVIVLLAAVLLFGKEVKGSTRWIPLGPVHLQPVEFAKVGLVLFFASYLEKLGARVRTWRCGFFVPAAILGVVIFLLWRQPDFGSIMLVGGFSGVLLLIGGVGWRKCAVFGAAGLIAVAVLLTQNKNRMQRLSNEKTGKNEQVGQAEQAFRNGGVYGVGIGKGMQREGYLVECHTDFIFSVIGEDFGLVATGGIWLAFLLMLGGGTVIALRAPDKQGMLLAFGCTLVICAQGAANMGVNTHVLPTKGLALPFFSYGGSSLIASYTALGLLLGVGRAALEAQDNPKADLDRIVTLG